MFNNRYFSRYFTDRYFAPVGAEAPPSANIIYASATYEAVYSRTARYERPVPVLAVYERPVLPAIYEATVPLQAEQSD